jgi:hypothetical protein
MSGRLLAWLLATFGVVTAHAQTRSGPERPEAQLAVPDLFRAIARRSLTRLGSCEHVESPRETSVGHRITVGIGLFVGGGRHGGGHAADGHVGCRIIV